MQSYIPYLFIIMPVSLQLYANEKAWELLIIFSWQFVIFLPDFQTVADLYRIIRFQTIHLIQAFYPYAIILCY